MNLEALSKWTGHIPGDVVRDMAQIAPMLARLGYDPYANPPNYGNPDPIVINNTHRVSACARAEMRSRPAPGMGHGESYDRLYFHFHLGRKEAQNQLVACLSH